MVVREPTDGELQWARKKLSLLLTKLYRMVSLGELIPDDPK